LSLRVVYYVRPNGLDYVLCQALALSRQVDLHLVIETSPEHGGASKFGPLPAGLPEGAHRDAWRWFAAWLPARLEEGLRRLAGLHLVVHRCPRAFYPRTLRTAMQAATLIRSLRPDVVHFDETWTRAAWTFALLGRTPIVVNVHDVEEHPGDPQTRIQTVRRLAWRRVSRLVFFSRYCERVYQQMRDMPSVPSSVVPLGPYHVFRAWETQQVETDPRNVLFFGRLSTYKGVDILLDAAPLIAAQVPGMRLTIAGAPVPGYRVPDVPPLPNGGTCELRAGFVSVQELCELFGRAAVVVLPYRSATQSGVVMTAYAFYKPVVVTKVGGLPEMVEDGVTGRQVPPGDPTALAHAVTELLTGSTQRAQMADAIRRRAEGDLSWDRLAEQMVAVYKSAQ